MKIIRHANAKWQGNLTEGNGTIEFGSGIFSAPYSFKDRTENHDKVTNPEELIAAAHAGCYAMALSAALSKDGYKQLNIEATSHVTLDVSSDGLNISVITLEVSISVANIGESKLTEIATKVKKDCPISKALSALPIKLKLNGIIIE